MNTLPSYTLASRPQMSRFLRAWAVLSRGTFSGVIFLLDVALIVAMSCGTGVAYSLVAYGDPGDVSSFLRVGVLAASIFAISNVFRGEYRLPNFFAFKPHARRTIQLWNVTLICLLMLGFLTQQQSGQYSRAWIVLFYAATLAALIVERFLIVRITAHARAAGLVSAQRIFLIGTGAHVGAFINHYEPWTLGINIVGCRFLTPVAATASAGGAAHGARPRSRRSDRQRAQRRARCDLPVAAVVGERNHRALRRSLPRAAGRNSSRPRANPAQVRGRRAVETRPAGEPATHPHAAVAVRSGAEAAVRSSCSRRSR